jgi:outer membrane receptor protein involved in Fe transport
MVMSQPARVSMVTLALCASAMTAGAQVERGVIRGTVSDSAGRPLAGAQVMVKNTDIRTMTGLDGRYVLPGVWPGETKVYAQRVGFQIQSATVDVKQADTTRADFVMPGITYLAIVVTDAEATSTRMAGFEQRRARGVGAFITRADIEKRRPSKLSEMLRSVAGVSIRSNSSAGQQAVVQIDRSSSAIANGTCEVQMYVDGHPYPRGNIDDFPPETVEGIEIYRGGSELPSELRAQNAGCGAIAIWTRDPTLIRRKP